MIVSEEIVDGIVVIAVRGKLMGASETDECHSTVKDYIVRGHNKIIVNMEEVEWVNSRDSVIIANWRKTQEVMHECSKQLDITRNGPGMAGVHRGVVDYLSS